MRNWIIMGATPVCDVDVWCCEQIGAKRDTMSTSPVFQATSTGPLSAFLLNRLQLGKSWNIASASHAKSIRLMAGPQDLLGHIPTCSKESLDLLFIWSLVLDVYLAGILVGIVPNQPPTSPTPETPQPTLHLPRGVLAKS